MTIMSREYKFADKKLSGMETFMSLWDEVGTALGNLSCSRCDHGIALVVTKLSGTVIFKTFTFMSHYID